MLEIKLFKNIFTELHCLQLHLDRIISIMQKNAERRFSKRAKNGLQKMSIKYPIMGSYTMLISISEYSSVNPIHCSMN